MASVVSSPQAPAILPSRPSRTRHRGSTVNGSSASQRGEFSENFPVVKRGMQKEYFAILFNLPYNLDQHSCIKYRDVQWKPIKDLMRKVINKEDDGRDIRPQIADSGKVNIQPDSPGSTDRRPTSGYAMCTLKTEAHAKRALRWLGGNTWYGCTLSIMICVKVGSDCRLLEARDRTMFDEPINLNVLSVISDRSLLSSQPMPSSSSVPFADTLQPHGRIRTSQIHQDVSISSPGQVFTWANYTAVPPNTSTVGIYPQVIPAYASAPEPATINNIMLQIDGQWRPYSRTLPPAAAAALAPVPFTTYAPQRPPHTQPHSNYTTYTTSPAYTRTTLSPTATSFYSRSSSGTSDPAAATRVYHTNTNGLPINTSHGAVTVSASTSIIVRNLPHKASQAAITSYVERGGCRIERYETKDGRSASTGPHASCRDDKGAAKKKLSVVLGLATAEDARRARAWVDGREWEGRRLSCEVLKDDAPCERWSGGDFSSSTNFRSEWGTDGAAKPVVAKPAGVKGASDGPIIANGSEEDEGSD